MNHLQRRARREQIVEDARQGMLKEQIMQKHEVSETTVKTVCREANVVLQKYPAGIEEKCFRWLRLIQNGVTPEGAAIHLGCNPLTLDRLIAAARLTGFIDGSDNAVPPGNQLAASHYGSTSAVE